MPGQELELVQGQELDPELVQGQELELDLEVVLGQELEVVQDRDLEPGQDLAQEVAVGLVAAVLVEAPAPDQASVSLMAPV